MTVPGDPLGSAISGAAQGVAETVTKEVLEAGKNFIGRLFGRQLQAANEQARTNVNACGADILRRLDALEAAARQGRREAFADSLGDPDTLGAVSAGLGAAARIGDAKKHGVLAWLIAERVASKPTSDRVIVANVAIETTPRLTKSQLDTKDA